MFDMEFYRGRKVFITGHTGFKGSWMCALLAMAGAEVTGYALKPPTDPSLFDMLHLSEKIHSINGDVRDLEALKTAFEEASRKSFFTWQLSPLSGIPTKSSVHLRCECHGHRECAGVCAAFGHSKVLCECDHR